jgi:glycine cleavage system aminomethyltransferase T
MKTDIKHTVDMAIKFVQQLCANDKQQRSVKKAVYFTTVNLAGFPCHCVTIIKDDELRMLTDETDKLCKLFRCWLLRHQLLTIRDKLVARGVQVNSYCTSQQGG